MDVPLPGTVAAVWFAPRCRDGSTWLRPEGIPLTPGDVPSGLKVNMRGALNEHGAQVMSPHFVTQPDKTVIVPEDKWAPPPAKSD